jgi:hypothetical protein
MDTSEVRRRVTEVIERAKRDAGHRRTVNDDASRAWKPFLETIAVPLVRQVANVLKVQNYAFTVFTPGASVRLMSDRRQEDFIELTLDTTGREPIVLGRASYARGGNVVVSESPIGSGSLSEITEEQVLRFLLEAIGPFVER